MSRIVSAVLLALVAWAGSAGMAAAAQPLTVDERTDQLRVDHLDRYTNGEPVAVRVQVQPAQSVTLVGLAPDGASLRVPLAREADGSFAGNVALSTPGTWTLAVVAAENGVQSTSTSFVVTVTDAGATKESALTMIALALASIGGGVGLIAVGRKNAVAAHAEQPT
jgi:hypothetical protein